MPFSKPTNSLTFPSYSFGDQANQPVQFDNALSWETTLVALPANQSGTLTTRTADDNGVITLASGHGITNGPVDVYWSGGQRRGMVAAVAGDAVTVTGGAGDPLPPVSTACIVSARLEINPLNLTGNLARIVAVVYRNILDPEANAAVDFKDVGDATVTAFGLVHETKPGGLAITNIEAGMDNIYAGNPIVKAFVSHNSQQAAFIYIVAGVNVTTT